MDADTDGSERPPLNLTRQAYGFLVIGAGVAAALLVLWNLPGEVADARVLRVGVALAVAVATGYAYQYVTNTWYEQFE